MKKLLDKEITPCEEGERNIIMNDLIKKVYEHLDGVWPQEADVVLTTGPKWWEYGDNKYVGTFEYAKRNPRACWGYEGCEGFEGRHKIADDGWIVACTKEQFEEYTKKESWYIEGEFPPPGTRCLFDDSHEVFIVGETFTGAIAFHFVGQGRIDQDIERVHTELNPRSFKPPCSEEETLALALYRQFYTDSSYTDREFLDNSSLSSKYLLAIRAGWRLEINQMSRSQL